MGQQWRRGGALDLPGRLATLTAPLRAALERLRIRRAGPREHNPADILVPAGYAVEVVATGFNAPVHCCFDAQGACYVCEAGHKIEAPPRILKVDLANGTYTSMLELPADRWVKTGALTGACWHAGSLYFTNTHTLSRLAADGTIQDIVTGLPGLGDHQTSYPVAGPDGRLYFGQGSVTNNGAVGADNFAYEWLPHHPDAHDVPARDITLAGRTYASRNVLSAVSEQVRTGAFAPFGTETTPGQLIRRDVKCSGAVLRCRSDGSELAVVAWACAIPTASPSARTAGSSPPRMAATSAAGDTSSGITTTCTISSRAPCMAGQTSPPASGWTIRTGARAARAGNRPWPSIRSGTAAALCHLRAPRRREWDRVLK